MNTRPLRKTIFCDIDGTIFKHQNTLHNMVQRFELLPGVLEKFIEWKTLDYHIIITTSRPESCRFVTEQQLFDAGIFYNQLIMGIPNGARILINDKKPDGTITSSAFCIDRDNGLFDINV